MCYSKQYKSHLFYNLNLSLHKTEVYAPNNKQETHLAFLITFIIKLYETFVV